VPKDTTPKIIRLPIAGIGASAGGLEAVSELLKHLPVDTGIAFVLIQHLDPHHESALVQILGRATSMRVREVTDNLAVEPNAIYVIPPKRSMTIAEGVLKLHPRRAGAGPQRSIDVFLQSLAEDQNERAIGVILSGTATDGTLGLEAIKAEGGITFAQDESARYDYMPRSAVASGCVDFVLAPKAIALELARIAKHPALARNKAVAKAASEVPVSLRRGSAKHVLCLLRMSRGTSRPPMMVTGRLFFSCAIFPGWIFRSTSPPPSAGASIAAWS